MNAPANDPRNSMDSRARSLADERRSMLGERIESVHRQIVELIPHVDQVVWVRYDAGTDQLETVATSSLGGPPLGRYDGRLSARPALRQLVVERKAGLLGSPPADGISAGTGDPHEPAFHGRDLVHQSSYAVPLFEGHALQGLLFMVSQTPDAFTANVVAHLAVYANLVRLLLSRELAVTQAFAGTVRVARDFAYLRDVDIGTHLDRMSRYSRLIARRLATARGLSDAFVEQVFVFAPLHDIGKVGISEAIVRKTGPLTDEERDQMAEHVALGARIIEQIVAGFQLGSLGGIDILRNIVAGHHEKLDGSGYPLGLVGGEIPLESRIVAVADIFDALTSRRTYKDPCSVDEALAMLDTMVAGGKLDGECVAALRASRRQVDDVIRVCGDRPESEA